MIRGAVFFISHSLVSGSTVKTNHNINVQNGKLQAKMRTFSLVF